MFHFLCHYLWFIVTGPLWFNWHTVLPYKSLKGVQRSHKVQDINKRFDIFKMAVEVLSGITALTLWIEKHFL